MVLVANVRRVCVVSRSGRKLKPVFLPIEAVSDKQIMTGSNRRLGTSNEHIFLSAAATATLQTRTFSKRRSSWDRTAVSLAAAGVDTCSVSWRARSGGRVRFCARASNELIHKLFISSLFRRSITRLESKNNWWPWWLSSIFFQSVARTNCDIRITAFSRLVSKTACCLANTIITPVYKKGNSAKADNHPPIAITSSTCKLTEIKIKDLIVNFLLNDGLITKWQHEFIKITPKLVTSSNAFAMGQWVKSLIRALGLSISIFLKPLASYCTQISI